MPHPNADVAAAIAGSAKSKPNPDKLQELQREAARARDLEREIVDAEEHLSSLKEKLQKLYFTTLPDLMAEVKLDYIGVPPRGNLPGVDYKLTPFYAANIAAAWPVEKREAAFSLLKRLHAESLIKTEVSAALPKGNLATAKKLVAAAKKLGVTADLTLSVHSGTLKAWLRDLYEKGKALSKSDLEKIGGSVGRVVRPEERKT
jgi:hypothetical protein